MFESSEYVPISIEEFQESINKWDIDDWQLWEFFREEYGDNPIGYFDQIDEIRLNVLRLFLIERGVWIQQEISAATALANTFKEKEFQSIQQHHQLQKFSPSAPSEISKPSARSEVPTPRPAPSEIPRPQSTPSEIPKPSVPVSASLLAPQPAPQEQSSVQQTLPQPVQQTPPRPTLSNTPQSPQPPLPSTYVATSGTAVPIPNSKTPRPARSFTTPKTPQTATRLIPLKTPQQQPPMQRTSSQPSIEPTSQQQSARTSPTSSHTTTFLITPHTPSYAAPPFINPTSPQAAVSGCIFYKKGMG